MPFRPIETTQQNKGFRQIGSVGEQSKKPGFLKGLAQSIASPALKVLSTGASVGRGLGRMAEAGYQFAKGEKEQARKTFISAGEPVEFGAGYLGKAKPLESWKESIGTGLQLGLMGVPGLGAGAGLGTKIATGATVGGLFAGGKALEEDKEADEILKSIAIGGLVGGAIPVAGVGLRKLIQALQKKLPERLVQFALKQPKKVIKGGKDISSFVVENKKIGTASKLFKDSSDEVVSLNSQVKNLLGQARREVVKRNDILDDVVSQINKAGGATNRTEILNTITKLSPQAKGLLNKRIWNPLDANRIRVSVDKTLTDKAFLGQQLPFNKQVLKIFNDITRRSVKKTVPATKKLFEKMSKEITLRDLAHELIAKQSGGRPITLFDLIGGSAGFGAGGPLGGVIGLFGRRAIQSPATLTGGAQVSRALGKAGEFGLKQLGRAEPVTRRLTPAVVGSLANR